jgi:hypothetical protein
MAFGPDRRQKAHDITKRSKEIFMIKLRMLLILCFAVSVSGLAGAQVPIEQRVDHFRCYFTPRLPVEQSPTVLQDQFDVATKTVERVNQLQIIRLCNPVTKITADGKITPIVNPNHHLTMFRFNPQQVVPRVAVISNQFGEQQITIRDPGVLAVPTGKAKVPNLAPAPPTDLDHYKCYSASGQAVNQVVALKDQFTSEPVRVLEPIGFCNPTRKAHAGKVFGIKNADAHLACYVTTPSQFAGAAVNIQNQFVKRPIRVLRPDILCVPSLKLQWAPVPGVGTNPGAAGAPEGTPTEPTTQP